MPGVLLIMACCALWATDALFRLPLVMKMNSGTIVLCEHALAVVAMLPWFIARRRELRGLGARGWLATAFVGVVGSALGTFFFTSSYLYINPSVVIILQKLQPVIAIAGAKILLKENPRGGFYGWAVAAIVGAGMVAIPEHPIQFGGAFGTLAAGSALALAAATCWGVSTVLGKFATTRVSFPVVAFLRIAWGLVGMLGLAAMHFIMTPFPPNLDPVSMRQLAYMALIPGALATYLYYSGLKRTKASVATFAELFFPVAAVLINWKFLGLALTATQLIGMLVLMSSVFFITRQMR